MSVTIKTVEMQYRGTDGQYHGINAVAEKRISDQIADIDVALAAKEGEINEFIEDAEDQIDAAMESGQNALNGIDEQVNDMIESIAAVAGQGTDTTMTLSGVAADAQAAGKIVKVSTEEPTESSNRLWIGDGEEEEYTIPTYEEFSELKSAFNSVASNEDMNVSFGWLQSTDIWPTYGTDRDNRPTRSRSGYILLPKNASMTITPSPWYIQWYRYKNDSAKTWIDASAFTASWTNQPFTLKNTDDDYLYRFVARNADSNANVDASTISVVGVIKWPIVSAIAELENNVESANDRITLMNGNISKLENLESTDYRLTWYQSTDIYPTTGTDRNNRPTRSRSDYVYLPKGAKLSITPSPWYIQWFRYADDGNKTWIDMSSFTATWTNAPFVLYYPDNNYWFRFVVRDANSNANVDASTINVSAQMYSILANTVKQNTAEIDTLKSAESAEFISPTILRICGGIEQNIYYQNIIKGFDAKQAYRVQATAYTTNYTDFARISKGPTTAETHGFRFNLYKNNGNSMIESSTLNYQIVPKSSGSGLSKKVMIIGDSLTFNAPMTKHLVDNLLSGDDMSIELVGTLGDAPYKREGRSGWGAYTYTHEASHTNKSGTTFTNAFWNPSTLSFDFSYYISHSGISAPDYVFICLGTNDFGRTDVATNLQTMITSIQAYNANIRVGVWTPPPRGLEGNGNLIDRDGILEIVSDILTAFEGQEANRVYTVPVTLNVDPYHDFPMESVNVSADNTAYQMFVTTDKVHPSAAGYAKMADMIYSYIKYFGSLDAT